jgi:hypothetical protein
LMSCSFGPWPFSVHLSTRPLQSIYLLGLILFKLAFLHPFLYWASIFLRPFIYWASSVLHCNFFWPSTFSWSRVQKFQTE